MTIHDAKALGYRCRLTTAPEQGWLAGGDLRRYRVYDPTGALVCRVATYRTARQAWAATMRAMGAMGAMKG